MLSRVALLAMFAPFTALAQQDVELRLLDAQALEVTYRVPATGIEVLFARSGDSVASIRAKWQSLDGCGSVDGKALHSKPGCRQASFRVPASTEKAPGYPPSFPMAGALYVHTGYYSLAAEPGTLRYRFTAPAVVFNGNAHAGGLDARNADNTAVLLMPSMPAAGPMVSHIDPALGEENIRRIRTVAEGTIETLRQLLPDAPFKMPALAAARVERPGGVGYDGDANEVLRVALFNWPLHPDPQDAFGLDLFVSHEFSHRFQMRDAVSGYREERLIHEGGGEFLRWMVQLRRGWMSRAQAARDLDDALGECLIHVGDRAWARLDAREIGSNRLAYRCGLPAWLYAMAARQGAGDAFARMNGFQRQLKAGLQPDFAQAIECGATAACQARWLPRLLGEEQPMAESWAALFQATGLATPAPASAGQVNAMMWNIVSQLVHEDCGSVSLFGAADGVVLDDLKSCKTLRAGMYLVRAEGLPMFDQPAVLPAVLAACRGGSLTLGLKDGSTLKLACGKLPALPATFYHVDIDRLLPLLTSTAAAH